jgi:DnaK suppressor protein
MDADEARSRLKQRESELQEQLDSADASAAPVTLDQSSVGRLSRMDAIQQQAMAAESQRRRRTELSQVRSALSRIDAGEWGDCLECGEPIAKGRLHHNPAVPLCIECARRR